MPLKATTARDPAVKLAHEKYRIQRAMARKGARLRVLRTLQHVQESLERCLGGVEGPAIHIRWLGISWNHCSLHHINLPSATGFAATIKI